MNLDEYERRERALMNRALQLVGQGHPYYNIAPVLDLIRQADALGFDLVRKQPQLENQGRQTIGDGWTDEQRESMRRALITGHQE
jgi:hypothetical protein